MITIARIFQDHFNLEAAIVGGLATPHNLMGTVSLILLTIQVITTSRGDDFEETVGHYAHDAVCFTQFLTLLSEGVRSVSTVLVAFSTLVLWISNSVQVHLFYSSSAHGAEDLAYPNDVRDVTISFSV